jgi:hypothetical protein
MSLLKDATAVAVSMLETSAEPIAQAVAEHARIASELVARSEALRARDDATLAELEAIGAEMDAHAERGRRLKAALAMRGTGRQ